MKIKWYIWVILLIAAGAYAMNHACEQGLQDKRVMDRIRNNEPLRYGRPTPPDHRVKIDSASFFANGKLTVWYMQDDTAKVVRNITQAQYDSLVNVY